MKILSYTLLLLLIASASFSQQADRPGASKDANWLSPKVRDQRAIALPDGSVMQNLKDTVFPKSKLSNLITPNTIIRTQQDVLINNNGQGFDVYRSTADNMPVLKPDQSFSDKMPMNNAVSPNDRMNIYEIDKFNAGRIRVKPSPKPLLSPEIK